MIIFRLVENFTVRDTEEALKHEFSNDNSNTVIILACSYVSNKYDISYFRKKFPNSKLIAFNQEPFIDKRANFMHKNFYNFLKEADEVWDYDERQVEVIKTINDNVRIHILKPYKDWSSYKTNKDIDILFYGALNEHREKVLNELKKKYKVVICNGVWGNDLDSYIARSKILLNIHYYYDSSIQEQARMIRWIGAPCRIVSEKSHKNYLNVEEFEYEDLLKL